MACNHRSRPVKIAAARQGSAPPAREIRPDSEKRAGRSTTAIRHHACSGPRPEAHAASRDGRSTFGYDCGRKSWRDARRIRADEIHGRRPAARRPAGHRGASPRFRGPRRAFARWYSSSNAASTARRSGNRSDDAGRETGATSPLPQAWAKGCPPAVPGSSKVRKRRHNAATGHARKTPSWSVGPIPTTRSSSQDSSIVSTQRGSQGFHPPSQENCKVFRNRVRYMFSASAFRPRPARSRRKMYQTPDFAILLSSEWQNEISTAIRSDAAGPASSRL